MALQKIQIGSFEIAISSEKRPGPWVVLLHGLQSNQKMYDGLRAQSFLRDHSILSLDFLGFGDSSKPHDFDYSLEKQCQIAIEILQKLGIQNFYLVGHSLGGMIGTLILKAIPDQIDFFFNFEGNLSFEHCGSSRFIIENYTEKQFIDFGFNELIENVSRENEKSALFRLEWLKESSPLAIYRTAKSIVANSKMDLQATWDSSRVNKIYICGFNNSEKYLQIEHVSIPDAGHFMLIDNPVACYKIIGQTLEQVALKRLN